MRAPLVSIIVTTYNRSKYLRQTLVSIHRQTFRNIEIILVDDGSEQEIALNNMSICSEFPKCTYYYKPNSGQPDSRNFGIKKAKGDYIAFCDDDDYWALNKLEKQVYILTHYNEYGIVSGGAQNVDLKGKSLGGPKSYKGNHGYIFYNLLFKNQLSSPTPLIRKEVFDKVGYFNKNFTIAEDWEFWRRASYYYKFYALKEIIAYVRLHNTNMTKKRSNKPLESFFLYRKLTRELLKWGQERFSTTEKRKIFEVEWKVYKKLLVNHCPGFKRKFSLFFGILVRNFEDAMHLLYLFLIISVSDEK